MTRRAINSRQIRGKSCGRSLYMEEYPPLKYPERKRRRDCIGSWQARYRDPSSKQAAKGEAEDILDSAPASARG
ncbi:hypothetical protein [Streptomyces halobius]|uniref:Integrase n=1 Tax=Streptomyces halobius TaxID=2879846 RepID=A0ABY4MD81_9ACTN|nr:hypothetical protein [Streptomyces halobius]UQA95736.1 hypothetical protein K9S39_31175 [Streptomyces halobius]